MKVIVKKSDFVLTPYMSSNDFRATYQILNTVVPYVLLWIIAVKVAPVSLWLLPPIIALITLFSIRCFSLMHDCGHYSLFSSKKVNRFVGFIFGIINAIPSYQWSRDHRYHHKTNGDWERYRGVAEFLSIEEFSQLSSSEQRLYELLRHPLMLFPGGFFYLAIKPRMIFLTGIYDFIVHCFSCLKKDYRMGLSKMISSHKSRIWLTEDEFWDIFFNNIFVVGSWIILSYFLGAGFFLSVYSIVLTLASVIFISIFFVQHVFDGTYAHKTEDWDYLRGAIEGTSYLELPKIFQWFTASIGYHNIHHLSERIPNYNLEACNNENLHLLTKAKTIKIRDMLNCSKFILWDPDSNTLVSIASFRQIAQGMKLDAKLG